MDNIRYSRKLLKKSLRIVQDNERIDLEMYIYLNLAAISNQLDSYESSLRYLELAYTLLGPDCKLLVFFLFNLKYIFKYKFLFWIIIRLANQYHLLSDLKFNEGYASFKIHQLKDAVDAFSQSHKIAVKSKFKLNIFLKP